MVNEGPLPVQAAEEEQQSALMLEAVEAATADACLRMAGWPMHLLFCRGWTCFPVLRKVALAVPEEVGRQELATILSVAEVATGATCTLA